MAEYQWTNNCVDDVVTVLGLSPGNGPPAQFPAVPSKLWLGGSPAASGPPANASPGSAAHHQQTALRLPAISRHHGPEPQHDAASYQQGVFMCASG